MISASGSQAISAGKSGLMDMLAGGHVDEATFRQAIELLRAEDWEALRLLLAGVPGSQKVPLPQRPSPSLPRGQKLDTMPDSSQVKTVLQQQQNNSKQHRLSEPQVANKKPKLTSEPSKPRSQSLTKRASLPKTDTASQTQPDSQPRQVGQYDRPWRAFMKPANADKAQDEAKQGAASQPAKKEVKPAARAKTQAWMSKHRREVSRKVKQEKERQLEPLQRRTTARQQAAQQEIAQARSRGPAPLRDELRPDWAGAPPQPPKGCNTDRVALAATLLARQLESQQLTGLAQPAQDALGQSPAQHNSNSHTHDRVGPDAAQVFEPSPTLPAEVSTELMWQSDEQPLPVQLDSNSRTNNSRGSDAAQNSEPSHALPAEVSGELMWQADESAFPTQLDSDCSAQEGQPIDPAEPSQTRHALPAELSTELTWQPDEQSITAQLDSDFSSANGGGNLKGAEAPTMEPIQQHKSRAEHTVLPIPETSGGAASSPKRFEQPVANTQPLQLSQKDREEHSAAQSTAYPDSTAGIGAAPHMEDQPFEVREGQLSQTRPDTAQQSATSPSDAGHPDDDATAEQLQQPSVVLTADSSEDDVSSSQIAKASFASSPDTGKASHASSPDRSRTDQQLKLPVAGQREEPPVAVAQVMPGVQGTKMSQHLSSAGLYPVTLMLPPGVATSLTITAPAPEQQLRQGHAARQGQAPDSPQCMLAVDNRVQRQRVVMQQLADMRQSASSLRERVAKLSGDVHPRMLSQRRSQSNSPVKFLQGSPTGSDRPFALLRPPSRSPSPAQASPIPPYHPSHPRASPDGSERNIARPMLLDRGASPNDSSDVRRVLAPSLVDKACSPMPEGLSGQLPLPDILAAVRQQLLEPWAAQQLLQAQTQPAANIHLPAPASEAVTEAAVEAGDEIAADEQQFMQITSQAESGKEAWPGVLSDHMPAQESVAVSRSAIPDARQLQMHDDAELGNLHSTADLAAHDASEFRNLNSALLQQSQSLSQIQSQPQSLLPDEQSNSEGSAQIRQASEAEGSRYDISALQLPTDLAEDVSQVLEAGSSEESNSSDVLELPVWGPHWSTIQQQQQQHQRQASHSQHATASSRQPNELMAKLAAAAVAEQSLPIRAIFDRHDTTEASVPAEDTSHDAQGAPASDADLHALLKQAIGNLQGIGAVLGPAPQGTGAVPESALPPELPITADMDSQEDDLHAVEDLPDTVDPTADQDHLPHVVGKQFAPHEQANNTLMADLNAQRHRDAASASKRSLTPTAELAADDSSGDTSPIAARHSRMKMRRTSGEYQQGILKQLHSFRNNEAPSQNAIADLQQADPLNIVNAALARQQAAVQAGCEGNSTCADPTNLVHTLYQRHQHLLQQMPRQLPQHGHTTHTAHATEAAAQAAAAANDCGDAQGNAEGRVSQAVGAFDSPQSFQGETVPDTPVAQATTVLAVDQSADTALDTSTLSAAVDIAADRADAAETDRLSSGKEGAAQPAQVQAAKVVVNQHTPWQDATAPYAEESPFKLLDDPSGTITQSLVDAEADLAGFATRQQGHSGAVQAEGRAEGRKVSLSPDTLHKAFQNELRRLEGIEHAEHELNMLQQAHTIAAAQHEMTRLAAADHRQAIAQHETRLQQMHAAQEAKLHQLSIDLRSELTSGSLAQLNHMVSEFMQQLRDSTLRQSHTDAQGSGSPSGLPMQPIAHLAPLANHGLQFSPESALQLAASNRPHLGLLSGPIAPQTAPTGLHHSADPVTLALHLSSSRELQLDSRMAKAAAQSNSSSSTQPQSERVYVAESVITEDDIELDLPQTEADSTVEEEAGLAGSAAAESVAESVSDVQYSMYFEDSAQRSPISAYRSPAPGLLTAQQRSDPHTPGADSATSHMSERAAAIEAAALQVAAQLAEKQRELNQRRREAALSAKAALVEQMKASIAEIDTEIQALKTASTQPEAASLSVQLSPLPSDNHQLTPKKQSGLTPEQQAILALTGGSKAAARAAASAAAMSTAAAADAAADISQDRPEAVAAKAQSLSADDVASHQSAAAAAAAAAAASQAGAVQRQLSKMFAGQASDALAQHADADSASESIEEDIQLDSQPSTTSSISHPSAYEPLPDQAPVDSISHAWAHEPLPDQAIADSKASSSVSTPRSLRPGTVPKLNLSPAIALHIASMDDDEEERDAGSAAEEEGEGKDHLASERQAAAMASFDDLSGPEDDDAASDRASMMMQQASAAAAAPSNKVAASHDASGHGYELVHPVAAAHAAAAVAAGGAQASKLRGRLQSASEQDESASTASSVSEEADIEPGLDSHLSSPRFELLPVAGSSQQAQHRSSVLPVDIDDVKPHGSSRTAELHIQADDGSFNDLNDILLSEASIEHQQQEVEEEAQRHQHMAPGLLALAEAALAEGQTAAVPLSAAAGISAAASGAAVAAATEANAKLAPALLTSSITSQPIASKAAVTAKQEVAKDSELHPSASGEQQTLPKPASKAEEDELPAESPSQLKQQQLSSVAGQQADGIAVQLFDELLSDAVKSMYAPGVQENVPVHLEHSQESGVSSRESGASSPEVDLLSNESFSWHPSSHSEEEDFDEVYGVDDRGLSFGDAFHSSAKAASSPVEQSLRQQHQQQRTASDATRDIQHSAPEDVGHIEEADAISMSTDAVTEYTGQLLQVMLDKAEERGGVATLELDDYLELARAGPSLSDEQHIYNKLIFDAVNDSITECIVDAWQQQPPAFLQQRRPLRRLPTTLETVAQAVQQKVVSMCRLSQHGQGDMQDINNLMTAALLNTEKIDAKCITWQEANMKMDLANIIFDDLIEDTAAAFLDACNLPVLISV